MKILFRILAAGSMLCFTTAWADSANAPDPMQRASQSVRANIQKNPNSAGLQNAFDRLIENKRRFDEKRDSKVTKSSKQSDKMHGAQANVSEASNTSQRNDSADRAEKVERPDRTDRPERPERVAHGHNH